MTTNVSSVGIWLRQSNYDSKRPAPTVWSIFSFIDEGKQWLTDGLWSESTVDWETLEQAYVEVPTMAKQCWALKFSSSHFGHVKNVPSWWRLRSASECAGPQCSTPLAKISWTLSNAHQLVQPRGSGLLARFLQALLKGVTLHSQQQWWTADWYSYFWPPTVAPPWSQCNQHSNPANDAFVTTKITMIGWHYLLDGWLAKSWWDNYYQAVSKKQIMTI